jgi:hypothetical protein
VPAARVQRIGDLARPVVRLPLCVGAELHDQPPVAVREHRQVVLVHALLAHVLHEHVVDGLAGYRAVLHDPRHGVACVGDRVEAEDQQCTCRRPGVQCHRGLERGRARPLGARQRSGDMEAVLRQQLVEVEARDPARDARVALADKIAVAVAQFSQRGVYGAAPSALGDDPFESSSLVAPTVIRVPSASALSSSIRLSDVRPVITECAPHELLAIMPPNVA